MEAEPLAKDDRTGTRGRAFRDSWHRHIFQATYKAATDMVVLFHGPRRSLQYSTKAYRHAIDNVTAAALLSWARFRDSRWQSSLALAELIYYTHSGAGVVPTKAWEGRKAAFNMPPSLEAPNVR